MNVVRINAPRPAGSDRAIALHCSGAGASQWDLLAETLGGKYRLLTPEHYGSVSRGPWPGQHAFTLADEAARTIALIDHSERKVHLVGHSYGGGVALHAALARPDRIASLALYEPSAFHLLPQLGASGVEARAEISGIATLVGDAVVRGDYRGGVAAFVDYWSGVGAWNAMRPAAQDTLIRWAPKVPLEFRALIEDPTSAEDYRALNCPALVLCGEHAPTPSRLIAEALPELLPVSRLTVVAGAGHMGPLTHAAEVSRLIAERIVTARQDSDPSHAPPLRRAQPMGA